MKKIALLVMLSIAGLQIQAQTEAEFEANYAKRIRLEMIDGVYIPADLEDAHAELGRLSEPKALMQFKSSPEDSIRRKLHFGLGRWILMNWGFERRITTVALYEEQGVSVPDDMVEVVILTWHRQLNNKPLELADEIAAINHRREEEKKERDKKVTKTVIDRKPHKE